MSQPFGRVLVGRTLAGRYELEEVIGSGGMSVVFRGLDHTLGRPVAVKVVSIPAESEGLRDNLRERFRREAASAARIPHHPNVVQIYDYGTDPELDLDFIVMELLRGRDLKQALVDGPPPPEEALRILREAARGLSAGHRVGIVHRDVKPANVFLVGAGALESVRLLDFGIAKPLEGADSDSITILGQLPHSPAYASPEQLDPERAVSPASDVYQLGLIGYELLTGERPFSERERKRLLAGEEVPLVETPRWRAVPAPLREVIGRALRRDPAERYPNAAAFAEALAEAEDRTLLHPPLAEAPVAVPADATVAMPAAAAAAASAPPAPPPAAPREAPPIVVGPPPGPGPAASVRRARRRSPALWGIPAVLLAGLIAVWAATRGGGDRERTAEAAPALPDTSRLAALEEEFVRLQGAASESLEDTAAPPPAAALPAESAPAPPAEDTAAARAASQRAEAAAIQAAVLDANKAWVDGDLDRHMSYYGRRVDYYNEENASRSFVRRDRRTALEQYPRRSITVHRQAVTFRDDGRARDLVDKSWEFLGDDEAWTGSMRQELILEKREGRWVIVSEKQLQVYRVNRRPR
ncbi:MAG TPA: serine/threonine-protein kinase [Longimicrobium sp.]